MKFVKMNAIQAEDGTDGQRYVNADQVLWLEQSVLNGRTVTLIHMTSGEVLRVDDVIERTAMRLEGIGSEDQTGVVDFGSFRDRPVAPADQAFEQR
jgi:hypothetical protein